MQILYHEKKKKTTKTIQIFQINLKLFSIFKALNCFRKSKLFQFFDFNSGIA